MTNDLITILLLLLGSNVAEGTGMRASRNEKANKHVVDIEGRKRGAGGKKQKAAVGADPNTALGRRQAFNRQDFVFDLAGSVPSTKTPAGTLQTLGVEQLPALVGEGLSTVLVNLEPCAINLPHVHQRATEMIYVMSGQSLRTAFAEENGGRVIVNDISEGMATFFPQGLIHYQQNLSCDPVSFIASLNHEDPGVLTITTQFFRLPDEAIEGSLGEGNKIVQQLIDGLPSNPADGHKQCMIDCGLWENDGYN
jgi:oxalate decarboxylase/phosphoglucose isomerase-like protein (cupin superfamily)